MGVVKNLMVRAGADFSAITQQANKAKASMSVMQTSVSKSCSKMTAAVSGLNKVMGLLGVGLSVTAVVALAKSAKEAYDEQTEASAKLTQVMRNTMGARADEIKSIEDLIDAQERLGVVKGDVQTEAAQELATYLTLSSSLKTLIPVMNDMVAQQYGIGASAESAVSIATMMGKVMNGQTSALSRYGYSFTAAQEAILKYGTEAQRAAVLAEVVEESVGGMNAALTATPNGRLQQVSNTLGKIKENFGQAVSNIAVLFIPALNAVCSVLADLATLANKVAQTLANVFGGGASSAATAVSYTGAATSAMEDLTDSTEAAGAAASKLGTAGFDTLQKLSGTSDSSSGTAAADAGAGGVGSGITEAIENAEASTGLENGLQRLIARAKELRDILAELKDIFVGGFRLGLGKTDFSAIQDSLSKIGGTLRDIFTDNDVSSSAKRLVDSFVSMIGTLAGSITSVGATLADLLFGGIEVFLGANSERIKQWLIRMFDVRTDIHKIVSDFAVAFADIFSVLKGDSARSIVASTIQIFSDIFMGSLELAQKFGRDILDAITAPFIDNRELIKETLEGFLAPIAQVMESIAGVVRTAVDRIVALYDEHIHPFIMSVKESFSEWFEHVLTGFNTYIKPVLDGFAEKFDAVVTEHVQPMVEKAVEFFGKLFNALKLLWDNILSPLVTWVIDNAVPRIAGALDTAGNAFAILLSTVSDVVSAILEILGGVLDFLTGVFTGDWELAWKGIEEIFKGVWNRIVASFEGAANLIINGINGVIGKINGLIGDGLLSKGLELIGVPNGKIPTISNISLPRLATGAVIPPNNEFAAILGDQTSGMNIEAPESLLREIFREELSMSLLLDRLDDILDAILSGKVLKMGNDVIGKLSQKYADSYARATGN